MREYTISIKGNKYRITGLDARQSQEFIDYATKHLPDPVDEVIAVAVKLPDGKAKDAFLEKHLDKALEKKKMRGCLNDPDLETFTKTPQGFKKLFGLMFKKHHPNLTEEEVYSLVMEGIEEHGEQLFLELYQASNKVPLSEEQVENNFFRPEGVKVCK